ncbi:MAG: hypothetical protein KF871_13200 [Hydrogenophaga sp.]|uniref:hypothetical protein n=1 Tax=Hydrogenophaga sp. TaxID=1904254 RepID=UPI001DB5C699|nr:hypothetical protein [Hydrogenophaga sp.]MBX3610842.1 hypothetical protein [Hydrogenophaga sp.]
MKSNQWLTGAGVLCALLATQAAHAFNACPGWDDPLPEGRTRYEVFASPYTHHWSYNEEHKAVNLVSLSRHLPDDRMCGLALFTNSFGQPSAYVYAAKTWEGFLTRWPEVYATVSAGVIYGYVGKYKDKVPLNVGGFAPAIVPSVGYRFTPHLGMEVQILGTAAFMVGLNARF